MRRVTILGALLLALVVPGTTAASSPFHSREVRDICAYSGGSEGYGYIRLKVRAEEHGLSGVNYFFFRAVLQEYRGGRWTTVDTSTYKSGSFPNDGGSWTAGYRAQWDNRVHFSNYPPSRIVMRVQFWDQRPGDDRLLATHKHVGRTC